MDDYKKSGDGKGVEGQIERNVKTAVKKSEDLLGNFFVPIHERKISDTFNT
eukprot:TRINITY_DN8890_c0_g1_i1.p3 TRINITY_DN8890_c0_g1~~TRINITY_DN8890_c0_g1_i1.p3  ORF type:complete len:51 (-),score=8.79 TRINITY_DN8890_c0_g1_i1:223-375(-)